MSEIGDLIGMDGDGRETLLLALMSSKCSEVTLGFPTKLMSLFFTRDLLKVFFILDFIIASVIFVRLRIIITSITVI